MTKCNTNHEERIHLFLTINQRSDAPSSRCDQNSLKGIHNIIMKLTTIQIAKIAARQKIFDCNQRIKRLFEKKNPSSTR